MQKDEAPDTWEVKENVAENVLRDYEDRWWTACREARALGPLRAPVLEFFMRSCPIRTACEPAWRRHTEHMQRVARLHLPQS